ncbi:MAG TPA: hypothetical protein VFA07_12815 [Chthonomonadaceae bacterium]|nr:hypothetical protein [Chthonomonadaceae bacterium]
MERALSQARGRLALRSQAIRIPWPALIWLSLIAISWVLATLPFVFWGWRGLYTYAGAAGLYLLACQRENLGDPSRKQ